MFKRVLANKIGEGQYLLDCYNKIILKEIACTITTRVNAENHKFVVEIYGDDGSQ